MTDKEATPPLKKLTDKEATPPSWRLTCTEATPPLLRGSDLLLEALNLLLYRIAVIQRIAHYIETCSLRVLTFTLQDKANLLLSEAYSLTLSVCVCVCIGDSRAPEKAAVVPNEQVQLDKTG